MTEDEIISALRTRIATSDLRIDMKTVQPPPIYGPATSAALMRAEAELGFKIPTLLRRCYSEVANGGFGPGAGLVGVDGGHPDAEGRTLCACYAEFRSYGWPAGLLPLWDWGDGAWSCVDALASDEHVVTMDETGPTRTRFTLLLWLEAWVSGMDLFKEIYEIDDGIIINPFTKKPMTVKRRGRAKGG